MPATLATIGRQISGMFGRKRRPAPSSAPATRDVVVRASYDAAGSGEWNSNHWTAADSYDADSANSKSVRATTVQRSRYETANNGWLDGAITTHADYLVRTGPTLQVLTAVDGFNTAVETVWAQWAAAVMLRRKLHVMAQAKARDGEPFGIMRINPAVRHPVQLDVVPIETEQCQTPQLPWNEIGYIDGIKFDDYGNPEWYDILRKHPGGQWGYLNSTPERIQADWVCHWFFLQRPGQHRGMPETKSTLNLGAGARRHRESTLTAGETAANFAAVLKTQASPDVGFTTPLAPFSSLPIQKNTMVALPNLYDLMQFKAEHPNATFSEFQNLLAGETVSPLGMSGSVARRDYSNASYASGRLEHQPWHARLDSDRLDCNDLVLDKTFRQFWRLSVLVYGWNADENSPPAHRWTWPRHPVADQQAEASANETRLRTGQVTPRALADEQGRDYETDVSQAAADFGMSVEEMKRLYAQAIFTNGNPLPGDRPQAQGAVA